MSAPIKIEAWALEVRRKRTGGLPRVHLSVLATALKAYESGWTLAEIAQKWGVSVSTVMKRLQRARLLRAEGQL